MAKSTLYNFNKTTPTVITDEGYTDCGATAFILGDTARAFTTENMVIRTASGGGGDLLVLDVDYELTEEDFYYTEEVGYHIYKKVAILNADYQTGTIYITYDCYGSYTDVKTFQDLLALYTLTDPKFRITAHTPNGFHGDVFWRSATQMQIKPKPKDGQLFTGAILNDGTDGGFLSLTADSVLDITTAGDGGILDGITRLANSWYRIVAYSGSDETLKFGLSAMLSVQFTNNNPTAALTLAQLTPVGGAATDIGLLFPVGGRLALWNASAKFETPLFYSGGALDATRDKPKVKSDRSATSLTLVDNLSIANFSANDIVYQVDGWKPLQYTDGLIASAIGDRGYMDTGIRILTDASGNILPFIIIGNEFYFCNGTGAADYAQNTGLETFTIGTSYTNFRATKLPPDKHGIFSTYDANSQYIYTKPYWATYGEQMYGAVSAGPDNIVKSELKMMHGILCAKVNVNSHLLIPRGYII